MIARPLRVLVNGSAIPARPAGAGVYTIELARALAAIEGIEIALAAPAAQPGIDWLPSPAGGAVRRNSWEQRELPPLLREHEFDLVHGAHMAVPLRSPVPRVATIHDLTFYRLPRRYSTRHRWYYRWLAHLAARAERVIVPSQAVANDVARYLSYPADRTHVVYEAPRAGLQRATDAEIDAACARFGIDPPYLLCVGAGDPGKRAIDAVRALSQLRACGARAQLVLAGHPGRLGPALEREAQLRGLGDAVHSIGYVSDDDLPALLSGASALIYPSLYEGFGLPPLEAMACGTPVIATNAPAMSEVLGDAAMSVPLRDPAAIARAARALLESQTTRDEWSAKSTQHAARFSWAKAAAATVQVYREALRS